MAEPREETTPEETETVGAGLAPPEDPADADEVDPTSVGAGLAPPAGPGEADAAPVAEADDRVAALEQERDELLDRLRRTAADFDNFRKRAARDQESLVGRANERLMKALLPVVDDMERALEQARAGQDRPLQEGVELVGRALRDALAREGLTEIETDGRFDPHVHEALLSQPSEAEEGAVIEVLQKGYRLGDRVLRPARVVISQGAPQEAA